MSHYLVSDDAAADIDGIWDWIAEDNERAADELIREICETCARIAEHPGIGRPRPKWVRPSFRFFLVRNNYWIVYDAERDPLEIIRVIHASRDIPRVFSSES